MFSASFYKNRVEAPFVFKMFSASFFSDILAMAKIVMPAHFTAALTQIESHPIISPSRAECHFISLAQW